MRDVRLGTALGLIFALFGMVTGVYYGISPILNEQLSGSIQGHEAGLYMAVIGAIIGLSGSFIGVVTDALHTLKGEPVC